MKDINIDMQTTNVNRRADQYDVAFVMKPWQVGLKRCLDIIGGVIGPNPQSPIPKPQSPNPNPHFCKKILKKENKK